MKSSGYYTTMGESKNASMKEEVKILLNDKPSSPRTTKQNTQLSPKTLTKLNFTRMTSQGALSI